jgi:hypothetical protein
VDLDGSKWRPRYARLVRPLFASEVFYVSADRRSTRRPVTIEDLGQRPLILYQVSAGVADPTRFVRPALAICRGLRRTRTACVRRIHSSDSSEADMGFAASLPTYGREPELVARESLPAHLTRGPTGPSTPRRR